MGVPKTSEPILDKPVLGLILGQTNYGDLLHTDATYQYWAVAVPEGVAMVVGATTEVCRAKGLQAVCRGPSGCWANDESM